MAQTGYEEEARLYAQATLLPGSESGGFGQNDVASPVFLAWSKQDRAGRCLDMALASLVPIALPRPGRYRPARSCASGWAGGRGPGRSCPILGSARRSVPWWPRSPTPCAVTSIRPDANSSDTDPIATLGRTQLSQ